MKSTGHQRNAGGNPQNYDLAIKEMLRITTWSTPTLPTTGSEREGRNVPGEKMRLKLELKK